MPAKIISIINCKESVASPDVDIIPETISTLKTLLKPFISLYINDFPYPKALDAELCNTRFFL